MKRQRLTETEERRLAVAIAAEARAMGLTKKDRMPQETKRRIRARVLKLFSVNERPAAENGRRHRPRCSCWAGDSQI